MYRYVHYATQTKALIFFFFLKNNRHTAVCRVLMFFYANEIVDELYLALAPLNKLTNIVFHKICIYIYVCIEIERMRNLFEKWATLPASLRPAMLIIVCTRIFSRAKIKFLNVHAV